MANLIGNSNNNNNNNNNINSNSNIVLVPIVMPNNAGQTSIRDVCSFLQPAISAQDLPPGSCPYDHIIDMIRGLDLQDDGIVMNHKIKSIEMDFCNIVRTEEMLTSCMEYINNISLADGETSLKFALLFSSRNFDALAMNETKVRCVMLKILETNYLNADMYRLKNKEFLYNSITMLGEYYHRVRLANDSPITILGKSLLNLLLREVSEQDSVIDVKLSKLILSQITLNGDIMREKHKAELTQLLYHIRRNLIEQPALKPAVKALLLMSLDLYYSRFANLGAQLEEMYRKYLVQDDEDEGNNNLLQDPNHEQTYQNHLQPPTQMTQQILEQQQQQQQQQMQQLPVTTSGAEQVQDSSFENVQNGSNADDSYEIMPLTKKWSEQVCEDSFYENAFNTELNCESELNSSSAGGGTQEKANNSYDEQHEQLHSSSSRYENESSHSNSNSKRSYNKQRNSPRPLKQNSGSNDKNTENHPQSGEERDESKPLPRWRAPRFNRDNNEHHHDGRNQQRRYSASYDDDHQSVRSDNGGSIRLYSINDRLKHSQEKIDRNSSNAYNSIANSNWDRQSQRDDHSERSYMSNYERGNQRRGGRHYNNRQTYDKPPRFQKNQQQQQHQQYKDGGQIKSDTWRRSNANSLNSYQDENSSYPSNGPESNSRSSSRARTLPRPGKSKFDGNSGNNPSSYRRSSQSPTQYSSGQYNNRGGGGGGSNNRGRNYNSRYNSQNSLVSEGGSSTLDRRHNNTNNRNNRNFERRSQQPSTAQQQDWEDTHSVHGQPEESTWDTKDNNNELVRNARNTTKYMNYLSSKK